MAVADEIAAQAAKDALAKEFEGRFNYIGDAYAQAQDAARANTQNVLDQLTQRASDYQTQFGKDARSAYINKMQGAQKLEGELSRLGLGNAGYGVTQRLMNEANYGTNLANLQEALNKNLTAIDQSKATASTELGNTLADLAMKQASQQTSVDQYIMNQLQNAYDTAYNRSYNERQDEIANQLAYARAYSGGGGYSSGYDLNTAFYQGDYNADALTDGKVDPDKVFSNGYQPNNINGYELKKYGKTVGQVFGDSYGMTGANLNNQNIWQYTTKNGTTKYAIWDGSQNKYVDVTKELNNEKAKKFMTNKIN